MRAKLPLITAISAGAIMLVFSWFYQSVRAQNYAKSIVREPSQVLLSTNNRTNIALLGIGGHGHEGGELTDSIIVASFDHNSHGFTLISLPRDLYLSSQVAKINSIYYYAEQKTKGSGLAAVKTAIYDVTSLPIHYALLLDFSGFIKAIDAVGGISVVIDQPFDDYKYPIPGKENVEPESERYEHLHFDAGPTQMDGTTALKYVRSRHAEGHEGTDFARSSRQQKVIKAFLSSLFSTRTVFNTERITTLSQSLANSLVTDIPDSLIPAFTKIALSLDSANSNSLSIDSMLQNPKNTKPYNGAWVLIPKTNWSDIHQYVQENLR